MKHFFYTLSMFCLPFFLLAILGGIFYEKSGGDLNRLGKISVDSNYRDIFSDAFAMKKRWTELSELNNVGEKKYDILTIGDSFSKQKNYGYQNNLATNFNYQILNFDYKAYKLPNYNPIQFLYKIINGDVFKTLKVDYVILQVVERNFVEDQLNTNVNAKIGLEELKNLKFDSKSKFKQDKRTLKLLINDIILYYRYGIFYHFNDHAYDSQVYKNKLTKNLFSVNTNELLYLNHDLINMHNNSTLVKITKLNTCLNELALRLQQKNIKLIVMPAADKYDIYYDYIQKKRHIKNIFFEALKDEKKNYLYVDTKAILEPYIDNGVKDVYFADDTHWSPIASKIVAKEIARIIKSNLVKCPH